MLPVLQVEELTKVFSRGGRQNVAAVNGVSFELIPGECLGMIGESGSGKTTIANMIARLEEPTSGRILLDGEDITRKRGRELREIYGKMQMIFQTPVDSFDPRRTLGFGISEGLRNGGMSKKAAAAETERLLERCGLSKKFAGRYPHEVSGGQCQRAAIARAIATGPKLLICDEATSALDVTVQKEIIELLEELRGGCGDGLSILFISHDISLVQRFCDRVLVLYHGTIIEQGTADDVISAPKSDYAKSLIDSIL